MGMIMERNANKQMTFAGVSFKTTKSGAVRRPAFLKILRSGQVRITCRGSYTDDYAYDAAVNFQRGDLDPDGILTLADDIERDPSGWRCSAYGEKDGELSLRCHSFLSYKLVSTS
jgi:hypothetical protein